MSLMFQPLRKYASFSGRARRKEYWLWQLFVILLYTGLALWLGATLSPETVSMLPEAYSEVWSATPASRLPIAVIGLVSLLLVLPSLGVTIRRIHDSGNSGWWVLLGLTAIGSIVILVFALIDGTQGPNRYGPDPKGRPTPTF